MNTVAIIDSDLLVCWWSTGDARHVLSTPASSVPVERIFTTSEKIFHPEITRLKTNKFKNFTSIYWHMYLYLIYLYWHCH